MTENPNTDQNYSLDWDDSIESDSQEYKLLPEGDYNFTVREFKKDRFPGSDKVAACNKAVLTLSVRTRDGEYLISDSLLLNKKFEWKLSGFFRSIGLKKEGQRITMDWNKVKGAYGRAHFKPRTYTGKDNAEHTVNAVDHYLDYDHEKIIDDPWLDVPANDHRMPSFT